MNFCLFKMIFTFYHGKSPLNHHLGNIFSNHLKQRQFHFAIDATSSTSNSPIFWRRVGTRWDTKGSYDIPTWNFSVSKILQFPSWCILVLPAIFLLCLPSAILGIMNYEPFITRRHDKWSYLACIVIRGSSTAAWVGNSSWPLVSTGSFPSKLFLWHRGADAAASQGGLTRWKMKRWVESSETITPEWWRFLDFRLSFWKHVCPFR